MVYRWKNPRVCYTFLVLRVFNIRGIRRSQPPPITGVAYVDKLNMEFFSKCVSQSYYISNYFFFAPIIPDWLQLSNDDFRRTDLTALEVLPWGSPREHVCGPLEVIRNIEQCRENIRKKRKLFALRHVRSYVTLTGINGMQLCCGWSLPIVMPLVFRSWGRALSGLGCRARENCNFWTRIGLMKPHNSSHELWEALGSRRNWGP